MVQMTSPYHTRHWWRWKDRNAPVCLSSALCHKTSYNSKTKVLKSSNWLCAVLTVNIWLHSPKRKSSWSWSAKSRTNKCSLADGNLKGTWSIKSGGRFGAITSTLTARYPSTTPATSIYCPSLKSHLLETMLIITTHIDRMTRISNQMRQSLWTIL